MVSLGNYLKAIIGHAVRGFTAKAETLYFFTSVGAALLTGPRDTPVADLTPYQIAWYVLMPLAIYAGIRLLLVGPYRAWQEQAEAVAGLNNEIARPERLGSDEFHRLKAQKKLDLTAEIRTFHWSCYRRSEQSRGAAMDEQYNRIIRLTGEVNPGRAFWRAFAKLHALSVSARDVADPHSDEAKATRSESMTYADALCNFLHGQITEDGLRAIADDDE